MTADYEDILYEIKDGVATLTINRPDKLNAFRAQTCEKLIHAFQRAGWDHIADLSSLVLRRSACSTAPRSPRKGCGRFGKNASRNSVIDSLPSTIAGEGKDSAVEGESHRAFS